MLHTSEYTCCCCPTRIRRTHVSPPGTHKPFGPPELPRTPTTPLRTNDLPCAALPSTTTRLRESPQRRHRPVRPTSLCALCTRSGAEKERRRKHVSDNRLFRATWQYKRSRGDEYSISGPSPKVGFYTFYVWSFIRSLFNGSHFFDRFGHTLHEAWGILLDAIPCATAGVALSPAIPGGSYVLRSRHHLA
ncbi:hypothetical protein B296_00022289 [Ensete ventricosum]|uniref:Uncharacterized protein n=1 Tax=Ensete ventricosum TaxID=4639 RepID=A0A426ZJS9_ENSVE|nr:hypothetical protein B296_00022289 [Ensete ventricosum]